MVLGWPPGRKAAISTDPEVGADRFAKTSCQMPAIQIGWPFAFAVGASPSIRIVTVAVFACTVGAGKDEPTIRKRGGKGGPGCTRLPFAASRPMDRGGAPPAAPPLPPISPGAVPAG